jgi:hypothetical protein
MSEEAGSRCMVLFADNEIPVELPVPRTVDEFQQGGVRPGSKRNRRNEVNADHTLRRGSPEIHGWRGGVQRENSGRSPPAASHRHPRSSILSTGISSP